MGYSKFALAFFGGRGARREQIRCSLGDVGSRGTHNVGYFYFSFFNDKKRQEEDTIWLGCMVSLDGHWAQHPGGTSWKLFSVGPAGAAPLCGSRAPLL